MDIALYHSYTRAYARPLFTRRSKYAGRPRGYRSDPDRFLIHQQVLVRSLSGFDFSPKSLGGDRSISTVPGR